MALSKLKVKKTKQIIIASSLLLSLCSGTLLYFVLYTTQLGCKLDFITSFHSAEDMTLLQIPAGDIKPNQDEIWYQGSLYDIASIKIVHGTAYLTVLHDTNEEQVSKTENILVSKTFDAVPISHNYFSPQVHFQHHERIIVALPQFNTQRFLVNEADYNLDHCDSKVIFRIGSVFSPPPDCRS